MSSFLRLDEVISSQRLATALAFAPVATPLPGEPIDVRRLRLPATDLDRASMS